MKKKNFKLLITTLALVFGAIAITIGASFALQYVTNTTTNKVSTLTLNGVIVEEYQTPNRPLLPSESVDKKVNVKNTGTIDSLVRVKVTKAWGTNRDANGNLEVDSSLNTDNIILDINTTNWVNGNDGYYYYKGILKPNQTTSKPLFTKYTIDANTTGNKYQGKQADILVQMETIQASNDAVVDLWGKSYEFLDVEKPTPEDLGKTEVTYLSPSSEFDIRVSKIDLFKNFKELTPGSGRSQIITISNKYKKPQGIGLKAEITEQDETKKELINRMLNEYITINIKKGTQTLYSGPISGNLNDNTNTMKDYISLGTYGTNEKADLVVTLNVAKEMGNEYQNLMGNIKWTFMTTYTDPTLLIHHYLEGTTIKLTEDEHVQGTYHWVYRTTPKEELLDEYICVGIPDNATGVFEDEEIVITYYYKLIKATWEEPVLTKTGPEAITKLDDFVEYNINYDTKITNYKGKVKLTVKDVLELNALEVTVLNEGIYDPLTKIITWTFEYDVNTFVNGPFTISEVFTPHVKYRDFRNPIHNDVTAKLEFIDTNETDDKEDDHDVKIDIPVDLVIHHYLEGTTKQLVPDQTQKMYYAESYATTPSEKLLENYELVATPENASGLLLADKTEVTYYYRLVKAGYDEPTVEKTGDEEITDKNALVSYKIDYRTRINVYYGKITVTITDQLSLPIDPSQSILDGGIYDAENKTITWVETMNVNLEDTPIDVNLTKNIKLKYTEFVKRIDNEVTGTIDFDTTNETDTKKDDHEVINNIRSNVITHHYVENTTKKISDDQITNGVFDDPYTTSQITSEYYELVEKTPNWQGKYGVDDTEVIYYYRLVKAGYDEPTIEKTGDEEITDKNALVSYKIDYRTRINVYYGKITVTITDQLSLPIDPLQSILDGGIYDAEKKTITWVETINLDLEDTPLTLNIVKNIKLKYTEFVKKITNEVTGTIDFDTTNETDTKKDDHELINNIKSTVITHHYIEKTTTSIANDVEQIGVFDDPYTTSPVTDYNYELTTIPDNKEGTYGVDDIEVTYYYTKKPTTAENEIEKIGVTEITRINDEFSYTISYNATIAHLLNGQAIFTIVDHLPYKIDLVNSDIAEGTYDEKLQTITWIVTEPVNTLTEDYHFEFTKNIKVKYLNVDYTKNIINHVTSNLKYEDKELPGESELVTTPNIPSKIIINHYYKGTTKPLAKSEILNIKIGDKYKTNASSDVLKRYDFHSVDGKTSGIAATDEIVINYYYVNKIENPYTGDNIIAYIIASSISLIVLAGSIIYIVKTKKDE